MGRALSGFLQTNVSEPLRRAGTAVSDGGMAILQAPVSMAMAGARLGSGIVSVRAHSVLVRQQALSHCLVWSHGMLIMSAAAWPSCRHLSAWPWQALAWAAALSAYVPPDLLLRVLCVNSTHDCAG